MQQIMQLQKLNFSLELGGFANFLQAIQITLPTVIYTGISLLCGLYIDHAY